MSNGSPLLSILVLNYKGLRHLPVCLASLTAQDFHDWELVFVDNRSEDGAPDWVRQNYPAATVVESPGNLGFSGGNNIGLPHCRGKWIFFLNNDTALEPGCLAAIAAQIATGPALQVIAPLMLQWQDPHRIDSGGDEIYTWGPSYNYNDRTVDDPLFAGIREVSLACAGAAVYPKDLLERIGGFDEDFFLMFEDVDLSLRARHAGASIFCLPTARVRHKGSASIGGHLSRTAIYYSSRNLFWAKLKNYPLLTLLKYAPAELLTTLLSCKGSLVHGLLGTWCKAHWDQLLGIPRMLCKRRAIQAGSQINRAEFERWLRKGWVAERIHIHQGKRLP